jgi:hypothetical protein
MRYAATQKAAVLVLQPLAAEAPLETGRSRPLAELGAIQVIALRTVDAGALEAALQQSFGELPGGRVVKVQRPGDGGDAAKMWRALAGAALPEMVGSILTNSAGQRCRQTEPAPSATASRVGQAARRAGTCNG